MNGISALTRGDMRDFFSLSTTSAYSKKVAMSKPESPPLRTESSSTLRWDLPSPPRTVGPKRPCLSLPICGFCYSSVSSASEAMLGFGGAGENVNCNHTFSFLSVFLGR